MGWEAVYLVALGNWYQQQGFLGKEVNFLCTIRNSQQWLALNLCQIKVILNPIKVKAINPQ